MQRFPSSNGGGGSGGQGAAGASSFMGNSSGGRASSSHQAFPSALVQRGQGQGGDEYGGGKPPSGFSWLEQQVPKSF